MTIKAFNSIGLMIVYKFGKLHGFPVRGGWFSAAMVLIFPKLLAAIVAATQRRVLIVMTLERVRRRKTAVAHAATKWSVAGRHS